MDLNVLWPADLLGVLLQLLNQEGTGLVNALLDGDRVGSCADSLQPKVDHFPGQH